MSSAQAGTSPSGRYNREVTNRPLVHACALVLFAAGAHAAPPEPRPALSWTEAESLSRKLDAIEKRHQQRSPPKRQTVLVTEGELNSYLNLKTKMPEGVSEVLVRLDRARLFVQGMVDLEQVRGKVATTSPLNPLSLLAGRVPVVVNGRLDARDGFGTVEVEDVRLGGLPMPLSVLERMVASSTRTADRPEGFDIHAPFRLPYSVRAVRIEPGQAILEF